MTPGLHTWARVPAEAAESLISGSVGRIFEALRQMWHGVKGRSHDRTPRGSWPNSPLVKQTGSQQSDFESQATRLMVLTKVAPYTPTKEREPQDHSADDGAASLPSGYRD
jgi:hypothetical protein